MNEAESLRVQNQVYEVDVREVAEQNQQLQRELHHIHQLLLELADIPYTQRGLPLCVPILPETIFMLEDPQIGILIRLHTIYYALNLVPVVPTTSPCT